MAFSDLDRFTQVNDTLGHAAGDAVLVQVAALLAERVRGALTFSVPWQDTSIDVRASVGVVLSDDHDGPSLVEAADAAMYAIKCRR